MAKEGPFDLNKLCWSLSGLIWGHRVLAGFGDTDNEVLCLICWDGFLFFFSLPGVWGKGKNWRWVQAPSNCLLSPF